MVGLLREALLRYTEANDPGVVGLVFTRLCGRPVDPKDDGRAWDGPGCPSAATRPGTPATRSFTELEVLVDVRRRSSARLQRDQRGRPHPHLRLRVADAMRALDAAMDWRAATRRRALLTFSSITPQDAALQAGNRIDAPGGGVLYAGTAEEVCHAETLAKFRPTPVIRDLLKHEEGFMVVGGIPQD